MSEFVESGKEQILDIPSTRMNKKDGCSIDIGGSAVKLVYTEDKGDTLRLNFVIFPRSRLEESLEYLKTKLPETGAKEVQMIHTTGIGCNQYRSKIEEILKVSIKNELEMDCAVEGFKFLIDNIPPEDLAYPQSQMVKEHAESMAQAFMAMITGWKENTKTEIWDSIICTDESKERETDSVDKSEPGERKENETDTVDKGGPSGTEGEGKREVSESQSEPETVDNSPDKAGTDNNYPAVIVVCGSGAGSLKMEASGAIIPIDTVLSSGRYLLGQGSLLTGAKTFEELMQLAAAGDAKNVSVFSEQLGCDGNDEYASLSRVGLDMVLFAFGHCVDKSLDQFKKEDLAAALVNFVSHNLAQSAHSNALIHQVKQVFFVGGVTSNSQLMRDEIDKAFRTRCMLFSQGYQCDLKFVKLGAFIGCLGALLRSLNST